MDHSTPTTPRGSDGKFKIVDAQAAAQIGQLETNCREFGVELFALGSEGQGIVHVIGPEMGLTQPGMTIVCGDSHTSTHGAFGALAFGIGTSEVSHVLATQCLLQQRAQHAGGDRQRPAAAQGSPPRTSSWRSSPASASAAAPGR